MILLRYLALSGVGIALFYLIDRLLLHKSTLLKTQRFYYIIAIVASLTLPLLSEIAPTWQSRVAVADLPTFTIMLEEEMVVTAEQSKSIDWWAISKIIWCIGIIITAIWLLAGTLKIKKIQRRSERKHLPLEATLYLTHEEIAPFTFGKGIYIPRSLSEPKIIDSILLHELEHIRQKHYIDILLGFVLQLVQWWNPFTWSMLHQQRNTLEYLADQGVLRQGKDRKTYQYHLLECTVGRTVQIPSLSFSMRNLKQRIVMMNSNKKSPKRWAVLYAIVALPVLALLLVGTQMVTVKNANATEISAVAPPPEDSEAVFDYLDDMPEFPGGTDAMMKWLSDNTNYPEEASKKNIQGRVFVQFIVEKDGSVSGQKIVQGVHELLDAEALRVVSNMPKWKPGMKEGKPVRARFTLPLAFSLKSKKSTDDNTSTVSDDHVFEYLDEMPDFPGGMKQLNKWLSENIKYPAEAIKNNIQGRVWVSYIIEPDGTVTDVKIVRGVHELLDAEALRVVALMPKWKPGKENGKPVRTRFALPVQFRLPEEKTEAK